jgi:hypothetical protein
MFKRRVLVLGLACAMTASCASPTEPGRDATGPSAPKDAPIPPSARVILKLRNSAAVDSPAVLSQLGAVCRCELAYIRPMAGAAHVLTVTPSAGVSVDHALSLLRADPLVDYVDRDGVKRTM